MNCKPSTSLRSAFLAALLVAVVGSASTVAQSNPGQLGNPKWSELLSDDIPGDMSPEILALRAGPGPVPRGRVALLNRAFNIYSWRSFLAINWPLESNGRPSKSGAGAAGGSFPVRWMRWKEAFDVFRSDGAKPAPWGDKRHGPAIGDLPALPDPGPLARILYRSSKLAQVADEEDQAFAGPLWDQSGNIVRYEVLMNKDEFDYVVDNTLYNLEGQIAFTKNNHKADFPSGEYRGAAGAIEIKIAWKILETRDIFDRYFHLDGWVLESSGKWKKRPLGMIGFHISQKTTYAPQWIWSTFEHVDNLETNPLQLVNGEPIHPSLFDPHDEISPVNVQPLPGAKVKKTQSHRMIPIPEDLAALNHDIQAWFRKQGSIWQHYELVGSQYPLDPKARPSTPVNQPTGRKPIQRPITSEVRAAVMNKSGGKPNLAFLTNMTMETYFQKGNQSAAAFMENGTNNTMVFGTEGCMGCHSSAGIATGFTVRDGTKQAIFGGQLTGDFSWLLKMKAQWANPKAGK